MKITDFNKQIIKRGISRPYNFKLEITPPTKLINSEWWKHFNITSEISEILNFQCTSANFPSMNLNLEGDIYTIPTSKTNDDLKITIRCGKDLMEKKFFDAWMSTIINQKNFLLTYVDDIKTTLKLHKLDDKNNIIQTVSYIDAFPQTMTGLEANHDSGSIDNFTVDFTYRKWMFE